MCCSILASLFTFTSNLVLEYWEGYMCKWQVSQVYPKSIYRFIECILLFYFIWLEKILQTMAYSYEIIRREWVVVRYCFLESILKRFIAMIYFKRKSCILNYITSCFISSDFLDMVFKLVILPGIGLNKK